MPPPPPGAVPVMSPTMRGKTARDCRPTPGVIVEPRAGGLVMRLGTPNPSSWTLAFRAEVAALLRRLRAEADGGIIVLTGARLFERDDEMHLDLHSKLPDFSDLLAALAAGNVELRITPDASVAFESDLAVTEIVGEPFERELVVDVP